MNIKLNNQVYNDKLLISFGFLWINNFKVDNLTGKLSSNSYGKTVNKNPVNTLQKILETRGQQVNLQLWIQNSHGIYSLLDNICWNLYES